ncbi:MAG TPA: DUF1634 domain-containing protein [Candidatus Binataceae bacterium]|nr:DUF1634 domain-containing protein [Candidatus Binataceae bacterium]
MAVSVAQHDEHAREVEEDRILRVWTPILLRTILIVAVLVLATGLVLTLTIQPDYYMERYRQAQLGNLYGRENLRNFLPSIMAGQPHAVLTLGLFILTLVPLARVVFCFILFLRVRDYAFVGFTLYVLLGLIIGIVLGRVG